MRYTCVYVTGDGQWHRTASLLRTEKVCLPPLSTSPLYCSSAGLESLFPSFPLFRYLFSPLLSFLLFLSPPSSPSPLLPPCRFPLDLTSVLTFLEPLALSDVSARSVFQLLSRVPHYTEDFTQVPTNSVDVGMGAGTWVITKPLPLYHRGRC